LVAGTRDLVSITAVVVENELISVFEYTRLLVVPAKQSIQFVLAGITRFAGVVGYLSERSTEFS
jgi:hypothetical protein